MKKKRTWVIVISAADAAEFVADGRVWLSSGKRTMLDHMRVGDRVVVYSPRTEHPDGEPLRAVTAVGEITGDQAVASATDQYRRAAIIRTIEPVPLAKVREHLPVPLLRFGCIALNDERASVLWRVVTRRRRTRSSPDAS